MLHRLSHLGVQLFRERLKKRPSTLGALDEEDEEDEEADEPEDTPEVIAAVESEMMQVHRTLRGRYVDVARTLRGRCADVGRVVTAD